MLSIGKILTIIKFTFVGVIWQLCFSGEMSQLGVSIEEFTGKAWDMVFQPVLDKVGKKSNFYSVIIVS